MLLNIHSMIKTVYANLSLKNVVFLNGAFIKSTVFKAKAHLQIWMWTSSLTECFVQFGIILFAALDQSRPFVVSTRTCLPAR